MRNKTFFLLFSFMLMAVPYQHIFAQRSGGAIRRPLPNPSKPPRKESTFKTGETWSHTEHLTAGSDTINVTTYFVFTSPTEVLWMFGTPFGNVFPFASGRYNPSSGDITFSASNKLHKIIHLPEDIILHISPNKKTAIFKVCRDYFNRFYNEGNSFSLSKESRNLIPNNKLVGSVWKMKSEEGELYFKTTNEVVFRGGEEGDESALYVCIGNMISIKSGDNIKNENLIGNIIKGNEVILCREGIDPEERGAWCGTFYKE